MSRITRRLSLALTVAAALAAGIGCAALPRAAAAAPSWRPVFATRFPVPAPLGSFSACDHGMTCRSLPAPLRAQWWAYPYPWPDTATQRHDPAGGYYDPHWTVRVSGGQMHIRMFRAGRGWVHSAAVIPKAASAVRYGRFTETFRVSKVSRGYKSAHLLWPDGNARFEVDFPENEWDTPIFAYTHSAAVPQQSFGTGASWGAWHTSVIEWTPGRLTFRLDGRVTGTTSRGVPDVRMSWIIQNEAALNGEQAPPGSSAQMDISYVAYDAYVP